MSACYVAVFVVFVLEKSEYQYYYERSRLHNRIKKSVGREKRVAFLLIGCHHYCRWVCRSRKSDKSVVYHVDCHQIKHRLPSIGIGKWRIEHQKAKQAHRYCRYQSNRSKFASLAVEVVDKYHYSKSYDKTEQSHDDIENLLIGFVEFYDVVDVIAFVIGNHTDEHTVKACSQHVWK